MANKRASRARLYLPFDALKGLQEALREKERIVVAKKVLSKEDIENISRRLQQIKKGMMVSIIYYHNRQYIQLEGIVSHINFPLHTITIVATKIQFEDILEITGKEIVDYEFD